uniref:Sodium/calcium exchanger membrane region domain-containing protein n=1 Tax=Chenopodium quinoa TaxID=63459 RepID=A0A803LXC7_CHEQI
MDSNEAWDAENGIISDSSNEPKIIRTAHSLSSSLLRKKSDVALGLNIKSLLVRRILKNLQDVILGTKICALFVAIPFAIVAKYHNFGRNQADVNILLLFLGALCHALPLFTQHSEDAAGTAFSASSILLLSRVNSIVLLVAYIAYLFFQLKTHRQLFDSEEEPDDNCEDERAIIGFWSAFSWLVGMTVVIALLSEYIVGTIEAASISWGIPISFLSIIMLPIVGNAAEHAGAIIFAYKNKLDISLAVALGSATQISIFVVPLCVIVAWIMHIKMDLSLSVLETGSFVVSVLVIAFTLQDGSSHYMKGGVLLFFYTVIATSLLVLPYKTDNDGKYTTKSTIF